MKASIDSIETFGLVDGPGIRVVVFFNGCKLRCKYCHNPEMWTIKDKNFTPHEVLSKILRCKPYFKNNGGVTFSGGEPLLHGEFIKELTKLCKENNISTAIDTSGVGYGDYENILKNIDLVILDIKHTKNDQYKEITGQDITEVEQFIKVLNTLNKKVWIRQVIIPGITDNKTYIDDLIKYLDKIKNIERVDFLPFHRLGREKYLALNLPYPYEEKADMDLEKCNKLYDYFKNNYKNISF